LSGLGPVPLRHLAQPLVLERRSAERTRERRRKLGARRARLVSVLEEVNHEPRLGSLLRIDVESYLASPRSGNRKP
jgi:hypothetical protein